MGNNFLKQIRTLVDQANMQLHFGHVVLSKNSVFGQCAPWDRHCDVLCPLTHSYKLHFFNLCPDPFDRKMNLGGTIKLS